PTLTCAQPLAVLQGSATGQGTLTLSWSTTGGNILSGQGSLSPTVNAAGWYFLSVLDGANDCSATDSVRVEVDTLRPFVAVAPPETLTCARTTLTLDAGASDSTALTSIEWSTPDGQLLAGTQTLHPRIGAPGTYTLLLRNTLNGCADSASVTVSQDLQAPEVDAGPDTTLDCTQGEVWLHGQVSGVPSPTLSWSSPDGQLGSPADRAEVLVLAGGRYVLSATNPANGCSAADTAIVVDGRILGLELKLFPPLCAGETGSVEILGVFGGVEPYTYSFDGGQSFQNEPFRSGLSGGSYLLVVEDASGCRWEESAFLPPGEHPDLFLPEFLTVSFGEGVLLNPHIGVDEERLAEIRWTPEAGLSCTDCLRPFAAPERTTRYRLLVRTLNGCRDSAEVRVEVLPPSGVFVPNAFSPDGDGVNDRLSVFAHPGQVARVLRFEVFSRWGERLFTARNLPPNDPTTGWDGTFRGRPMGQGVYVWFAEVEWMDGRRALFRGDVVLLR
ncbi:MAG: gliding motility-associated C-terminal domain-containing protein, partial [Bacteroidetes bacterium]